MARFREEGLDPPGENQPSSLRMWIDLFYIGRFAQKNLPLILEGSTPREWERIYRDAVERSREAQTLLDLSLEREGEVITLSAKNLAGITDPTIIEVDGVSHMWDLISKARAKEKQRFVEEEMGKLLSLEPNSHRERRIKELETISSSLRWKKVHSVKVYVTIKRGVIKHHTFYHEVYISSHRKERISPRGLFLMFYKLLSCGILDYFEQLNMLSAKIRRKCP